MTTTKQDNIGYCVYVQVDKIFTLKMTKSEFVNASSKLKWIKRLLGEKSDVKQSVYLEGVYKQFSDPTIDIFVDSDGIGKGLERIALTPLGLELFSNVVVLASDDEGETILLTKQQVPVVLKELGFYQQYKEKAKDDNGDMALVMCLHGDPKLIDSCQKMLRDFINNNLGSADDK